MKKFIILCIALFATPAIAQTINWYVDNEIYQTTTCSGGDDVTPPSAPARRGYTFTGWRDTSIIIGTWAQSWSPTPDNPTYPTFYQDGDLILRAVGSGNDLVADIYSASTGIITRRIGVKVLDGTETGWQSVNVRPGYYYVKNSSMDDIDVTANSGFCSHAVFSTAQSASMQNGEYTTGSESNLNRIMFQVSSTTYPTLASFQQYLADQYAAGTPVTIYYPLATPTLENYTPNANLE